MRIDPKYFNLFIGICALITVPIIIYSTIRYSQNQTSDFEKNIAVISVDTLSFRSFSAADSLHINEITDRPIIIHFWSTWSDKSKNVGEFLKTYAGDHEELIVVAATVRDSDDRIREFIDQNRTSFRFVDGTDLFYSLLVPGIPSQVFIDRDKQLYDTHVGNDISSIEEKLNRLLNSE